MEAEASDASCCARLERWLTSPASKRLLHRVCRELELGEHDAFDLIIEYAKFLELKLALSDHGDTEDEDDARWNRLEPPLLIAAVWRLHVLDTLNYSRFCAAVFAGPMHYDPEGDKLISLDYRSIAAAATVRAHLSRFGGPPANTDGAWRFDPDLDEGELDPWRMAEADAHRLHWRVAALAPKAGKDARAFGHVPPAFAAVVVDGVTLHDDEVLDDPNAECIWCSTRTSVAVWVISGGKKRGKVYNSTRNGANVCDALYSRSGASCDEMLYSVRKAVWTAVA